MIATTPTPAGSAPAPVGRAERMIDADDRLLERLRELEIALHDPAVRADRSRVDALLHPGFVEIGRSGRRCTKDGMLALLVAESSGRADGAGSSAAPRVLADDFVLRVLQPGLAMLTYRSAQVAPDGTLARFARRTSIWQWHGGRWRMGFHQGTPIDEA